VILAFQLIESLEDNYAEVLKSLIVSHVHFLERILTEYF